MISIYSKDNTEYTKNGDAVLIPTRCDLSLTINGAWQLTLEHPYDQEERYKYIVEGAVVQCDIKCIRELPVTKQRFRIYTYTKGLHGITAIGFPIAMEATYDAPIDNLVISGKTGAQAMALIQAFTNKYTLSTDVTKTASASMSNTNVNSAIASGNANSFIGAWGGEILYSNYDFMVKNRLGDNVAGDHRIIYGRNLTNIEYKKDDSGLTTRIYPISEDGIRLNGTGYVDSPKISDYPIIHHRFMQAPYNLIDTDASSATATAQQTRTSLAAISTAATTLSQGVDISSYPPEYIKQQRADIVAAVQTMALNGVISTSLYNAAAKTISDAMAWMNNLAQPEWDWMGSYEAGWKYGNSDGYAVSQYIKIGKTWRYFGSNGNWQEPADSSNEWDWYQNTSETGKKYGDFSRYYAHNEYVFITLDGQLKQYWFNEEGWYEEDESGDSDYGWNGTGTAEDPYWFGESSSKYLKSCWAFIDGIYYFFDEYGYYDGSTKFDDYQWDWVDDGSRAWFGNPDHEYAAYYLTSQWCKIDGSWYYFDNDGYVYDDNAARANVISLYTTGMASLATTVSTQATALYTLLYSLMTAYAQSKFNSGVDMPYITITVNMADLSKTTEYAGYENLETVKLGDSVECIDNEHDISMTNRVIGLTYDVLRDYNSEVVLGNAAATVASIVGNANGQAVAGGFDTSAIESQLDSLQNKMGDFLVNGASVVTNGVGQLNFQAGENISISRDGRTLTISGEGGGNTVYAGTSTPSASIGAEDDLYLQIGLKTADILSLDNFSTFSEGDHVLTITDWVKTDRTHYAFTINGNPDNQGHGELATFLLEGLVDGNTYHLEFDGQYNSGATFPWGLHDCVCINNYSGRFIEFQKNSNLNHYSGNFTYHDGDYILFNFPAINDNVNFTFTITNLVFTGSFVGGIDEIYGKVDSKWHKYEGGETYTDFVGTDGTTDGASGLVPAPTTADVDKVLKSDGTWGDAAAVEANPSGTATDELKKIDIDGTIYDIKSYLIQNAEIYSEDEKQVGVWIDGKPLYQRTIHKTTAFSNNVWTSNFLGTAGSGIKIIGYNGYAVMRGTEQLYEYSYWRSTNEYFTVITSTVGDDLSMYLKFSTNYTLEIGYCTIWYTKNSDTAGSGGYQAYGFSPIIYSETEREIGVWIDNKPLYAKTVATNGSVPSGAVLISREVINANYDLILYTKSSDTAGSGSYNTLGVPTVHYSTDEQVIGTWMDKPLYQKTITIPNQQVSQTMEIDFSQYISNIELIWADLNHSHIEEIYQSTHYYRNFTGWKGLYDSVNTTKIIRYTGGVNYEAGTIYNLVFTVQYTKTTDV